MGIRLYDSLVARGFLEIGRAGLDLTPAGEHFAGAFGVDLTGLRSARAPLCRECLDWSERRSHLAGSLGRAFLSGIVERGWAARDAGSRVVRFSRQGEAAFAEAFPHESS
jgi:hypothetical protein